MRDFNRDRNSGGRQSGGRSFPRRDFDRPQVPQAMHQAICSDCGKTCEVPFKPNGSKPVFCRDCFQGKRSSDAPRSEGNYPPRRSNYEDRGTQTSRPVPVLVPQYGQQLEALNAKLDKILGFLNEIRAEQVLTTKEPIAEPVVIVDPKTEELSVTKSSASRIKKVTKKASRK